MIEDLEGLVGTVSDIRRQEYREIELDFIRECIDPPRPEELVQRIDDIQGEKPPKAIDDDDRIAEMIEPIRDQIPPKYLEAPNDMEQVSQISDLLSETNELRPENWKNLSLDERVALLNKLEHQIAAIEHRDPCPIKTKDMGAIVKRGDNLFGSMGEHTTYPLTGYEDITINSELMKSNDPKYIEQVLDTLIHEGRHSYQTYNLTERVVHTSKGDVTNWWENKYNYGYQSPKLFGGKLYWMQPIETDARKFAEDVLSAYKQKIR